MNLFYWASWVVVRFICLCWGWLRIKGRERVPLTGPLILAVNHSSYFDPPVVAAAMPREISFMARKSLFKNTLFRWWITKLNAFPIDRDGDSREALREFCDRLSDGRAVLMFPEGTRSYDGRLAAIEPGIATIATRSGAPILPIYVWGTHKSWPKGVTFPRPYWLRLTFGEVIPVQGGLKGAARKVEQERVLSVLEKALQDLEKEVWAEALPEQQVDNASPRQDRHVP